MPDTIIYKKGCDPYTVTTKEALAYHITQGWSIDPKALEDDATAIPATIAMPMTGIAEGSQVNRMVVDAEVKELREIVAARDAQIAEMKVDFEEELSRLNAKIRELMLTPPEVASPAIQPGITPVETPDIIPEGKTEEAPEKKSE